MTALRGMRGVIAAPFYLVIPPVLSAVFAVITAVVIGAIDRDILTDPRSGEQWLQLAATGWVFGIAGLAAGLLSGAMGLQSARPAIAYDTGAPWLGRATRAIVSATVVGIAVGLLQFLLRSSVGLWAPIALVVLLVVAALATVLLAILRIPVSAIRGRREEQEEGTPH